MKISFDAGGDNLIVTFKSESTGRISRQFKPDEGSFEKGRYVIFNNTSNPFAHGEKADFLTSALSTFNQQKKELISLLNRIAEAERSKEQAYLRSKKEQILNKEIFQNSPLSDQYDMLVDRVDGDGLSLLINLLLQTKKDLDEVVFGLNKRGTAINTSGVWDRKFVQEFRKFLSKGLGGKKGNRVIDDNLYAGTLNDFITQYIDQVFVNVENDSQGLVETAKQAFREEIIQDLHTNHSTIPTEWVNNLDLPIYGSDLKKAIKDSGIVTVNSKNKSKTVRQQIYALIRGTVANGIAAEYRVSAQGAAAVGGGGQVGNFYAKTDVYIVDSASAEITVDQDNIRSMIIDAPGNTIREKFVHAQAQILDFIGPQGTLIAVSAKDYGSHYDFSIAGNQKFRIISERLAAALSRVSGGIDSNKLLFELNNIVDGAFLENEKGTLKEQLGLLIAAWMFDDIEEMFAATSVDNILHVYFINDHYITLSNLLTQAALELEAADATSMAQVDFTLPSSVQAKYYSELYRSPIELDDRWNIIREYVEEGGSADINLNYWYIERLGRNLQNLFRS